MKSIQSVSIAVCMSFFAASAENLPARFELANGEVRKAAFVEMKNDTIYLQTGQVQRAFHKRTFTQVILDNGTRLDLSRSDYSPGENANAAWGEEGVVEKRGKENAQGPANPDGPGYRAQDRAQGQPHDRTDAENTISMQYDPSMEAHIHLTNNETIKGYITSHDDSSFTVQTAASGTMVLDKTRVSSVFYPEAESAGATAKDGNDAGADASQSGEDESEESSVYYDLGVCYGYFGPAGPSFFRTYWQSLFFIGLRTVEVTERPYKLFANLDAGAFGFKEDAYLEDEYPGGGVSIDISPVVTAAVDVGLHYYPIESVVSPYVLGAVGLCGFFGGEGTAEDMYYVYSLPGIDTEGIVGSVGAGIEVGLGGLELFAEVKYSYVLGFSDNTTFYPIRIGVQAPVSEEFFDALEE